MSFKRVITIAIAALLSAGYAAAQSSGGIGFEWDLRFDTRFDNHEFSRFGYGGATPSGTWFSVRLAPAVGLGWGEGDSRHRVMAGGSFTLDMGAPPDGHPIEPLVFYNYRSSRLGAWAGRFERRHLEGSYSRAIYAGGYVFYDDVIEGMALQYRPGASKLEVVLDWDGMQSADVRESFRVLSSGEWNPQFRANPHLGYALRWFSAGYSLDMYHLASRTGTGDGVVDHILVNPWIGASLERLVPWFGRLSLQVGWLNSFDRDRLSGDGWLTPGGANIDFDVRKWSIGVRNRLYVGDKQMPLWNKYGSRIYKGDPLYSLSRVYNFTQIYWHPRVAPGVVLQFELGIHYDGRRVGWQQVAWIGVSLDSSFFKRK